MERWGLIDIVYSGVDVDLNACEKYKVKKRNLKMEARKVKKG